MKLIRTAEYEKNSRILPKGERAMLVRQEKLLIKDIRDPRLHLKKVRGLPTNDVYSFRVSRRYRAILRLQREVIVLFAIGHRKDIYR